MGELDAVYFLFPCASVRVRFFFFACVPGNEVPPGVRVWPRQEAAVVSSCGCRGWLFCIRLVSCSSDALAPHRMFVLVLLPVVLLLRARSDRNHRPFRSVSCCSWTRGTGSRRPTSSSWSSCTTPRDLRPSVRGSQSPPVRFLHIYFLLVHRKRMLIDFSLRARCLLPMVRREESGECAPSLHGQPDGAVEKTAPSFIHAWEGPFWFRGALGGDASEWL